MKLHIPQVGVHSLETIIDVSESDIMQEPNFRRALPEFAYKYGGSIIREFLNILDAYLSDNTRILVRSTPFWEGYYPSAPDFHPDTIPGIAAYNMVNTIQYPMETYQSVIFDKKYHPRDTGSIFLNGILELDTENSERHSYSGVSHTDLNKGNFHWYHLQAMNQIKCNKLKEYSLLANRIYFYTSKNFHRCPILNSTGGHRLLIRIDNPHKKSLLSNQSLPFMEEIISPITSVFKIENNVFWEKVSVADLLNK